jgi:SAM-dependent methyltransferase
MKESLLKYLVCPISKQELTLEKLTTEGEEVIEGFLRNPSGNEYPIIGGVPRMLPPHLLEHLPEDYPEFYKKYRPNLIKPAERDVQRHTQEAFGYEWTWAGDYNAENFNDWLPQGFTPEQLFTGKVGLEVGCGAGRHADRNSKLAKTHIAVDLSRAVDSAFPRNRNNENCHVVQADCFNLPFKEGTFDYVYCLGVLQHMHNPPEGFRYLAKQPGPGGKLLINVYQSSRPVLLGILEGLRKITTRMSNPALKKFSEFCGVIDYYGFIAPWKIIKPTALGKILKPIVPGRIDEYAKHDFHTCVVDWFDRLSCPVKKHYSDKQLQGFYEECGYKNVVVKPYWKAFWNGYGERA